MQLFDDYQRAIEYQPQDRPSNNVSFDWQAKAQLITEQQLSSLKRVAIQGNGCDQEEVFINPNEPKFSLTWLPKLKLIKHLKRVHDGSVVEWKLTQIVQDIDKIKAQFSRWMSYKSIDYADLGDNENDPFICKMIHLGFIEHSHAKSNH
jgi:hypothetical protein